MQQPDLFELPRSEHRPTTPPVARLDMVGLLDRLTATCERPRYNFMLLTLIADASAATGRAGPSVRVGDEYVQIRDWLCDAMSPVGRREPRRLRLAAKVRAEFEEADTLPDDEEAAAAAIDAEVRDRLRRSGRTNVSRAVTELVRAGLLRRHYQGDYVDHHNRGAQRQAVYTITAETRRALAHER